jgi:hypothetical protein
MADSESFTAFVNECPVRVPAGTDALGAVRAADPGLAEKVLTGAAYLTDGRGIPCAQADVLAPGAILRVIVPARRPSPNAHS